MKKVIFLIFALISFFGTSTISATETSTSSNDRITKASETKDDPIAETSTQEQMENANLIPSAQEQEASTSPESDETVLAQKISLTSPVSELRVGKTTQLSVIIQPSNTTDQTYIYQSLTPQTATVDENGLVKALAGGEIIISVTTSNNVSAKIKLTAYNLIPVYRVYLPNILQHHYSVSQNEITTLVMQHTWQYETLSFFVQDRGSKPVYRLYLKGHNLHLWTMDENERNVLKSRGWQYEGIAWYNTNKGEPVYRAYSPTTKEHLYTSSLNEYNTITKTGVWKKEGIAWYSPEGEKPTNFPTQAILEQTQKNIKKREEDAKRKEEEAKKPKIGKPYYYSQWDGRWSANRFNSSTIGPSGCVPTSLAMILKGSYGMNLTPADVAARMDYYSGWAVGASGKDIIVTANSYGHSVEVVTSQGVAEQRLREGYPLIWLENVGIGHAVVSFGNNGGKTEVLDPYNRQFFNGWYDISYLWSKPSADPMDWDAGRPVFVIK